MNYPVWVVPFIGGGWVIGSIAIVHVLVSHFAVGGGFYLPLAERKALREGRDDWMEVLRGHSRFFLILTAVFGAVTGVGIWFAISLASPEATSALIHYFVFGWAIEWVFFMVEITSAAVYYYTWGRISDKAHLAVGWVYAGSAWISLFIINGILTFMLTPGEAWLSVAGTGLESSRFWQAFFNPTYWPSLLLRTLVCISLAGIWALVTASRIDSFKQPKLKAEVVQWSAKWLIPSFVLMPACFIWYLHMVPGSQRALIELGISTIGQGTFTQVTRAALVTAMTSGTIAAIVYFLAWRNPRDVTFGHACAILLLALAATASTEQAREMIRKPYVIGQYMYSNSIRVTEPEGFNRRGYLAGSIWARHADDGVRGELMLRGQCLSCHTQEGYRSLKRLLAGRDREAIVNILAMLHERSEDSPYRSYMPPLVGTPEEIAALADYLHALVQTGEGGREEYTVAGTAAESGADTP